MRGIARRPLDQRQRDLPAGRLVVVERDLRGRALQPVAAVGPLGGRVRRRDRQQGGDDEQQDEEAHTGQGRRDALPVPRGMIDRVAGWQSVDSTAVEAYRWRDGVLALRYVDNAQTTYEYPCDEALLARFLAAESKGAFINQVLKPLELRARTREQFALRSRTFESPSYLFTDEGILGWIEAHTPVRPDDRILDVAGGTGALGRYLVRGAASCVVMDLVPEMLAAGPKQRDVLYVLGDATEMPFADAQFDLLVSRFAVHHFDDPAAVFHEMARVGVPARASSSSTWSTAAHATTTWSACATRATRPR